MVTGNELRWRNGNILHPAVAWKSPSKRRVPKLLVQPRAREVGILVFANEGWIVFRETDIPSETIDNQNADKLEFYAGRFYLLPAIINKRNTYEWIQKENNALLLWARDDKFYVSAVRKQDFPEKA